ncbi:MAG: hypothetical protein HY205_06305 [Nitrospirae bacterium]|nr:hypothetical protein [Nitrospirota bacterium]
MIICFGDSLTAGYQSPTSDFPAFRETPYGAMLQEELGPKARVAISGVCGELTGEMVLRFRRDVLAHAPAAVVVLGGTNDLGWNAAPAEIMRNLLKMYERALAAGIRPVAVTVPSIRHREDVSPAPTGSAIDAEVRRWLDEHIARRQELNELIIDYCARRPVACVDLFAATAEPETLRLAEPYSNDGLHLTTEGYRLLADLLYRQVFANSFE